MESKVILGDGESLEIMMRSIFQSLYAAPAKTLNSFAHAGGVLTIRLVPVILLALVLAGSVSGQTPRKVYISVDMEGISGISGSDQYRS
jgi:hypothetical protein